MPITIKYPLIIAILFLWIGFVCAISFMEAWLKFRAPGVNLSVGLGIGRLVFNALNKVEWVFALAILVNLFISKHSAFTTTHALFYIPFILLLIQTVWLLPALDIRAQMHIDGKIVPPSNMHLYYIVIEVTKVVCLFIFSIKLF
jgi:hypothetical protein